jgi:hypothetical protein
VKPHQTHVRVGFLLVQAQASGQLAAFDGNLKNVYF